MIQKKCRIAIFLLLILMVGTVLTACSMAEYDSKNTGEKSKEAVLLGPEEEMVVAVNVDGNSPQLTLSSVWMNRSEFWGSLMFRGLFIAKDNINDVEMDLCKEYAVSPDGLVYVFTIQNDVFWHDGELLTIEDVIWTIETYLKMQQVNGYVSQGLKAIQGAEEWIAGGADSLSGLEVDGDDLTIHLKEMDEEFLSALAQLAILPKHCFKETAVEDIPSSDFWKLPIGNGPYKMVSNENNEAVLVYNDQYTETHPGIQQIRYKVVNPTDPGEFDLTFTSDPEVVSRYQADPDYEVVPAANLYYRYLIFNLDCRTGERDGRLDDERVRQALMYGLDRRSIINNIYKGTAINIDCGIPEYDSWYVEKSDDEVGYRPALAKEMLMEAGFDFEEPLILTRYNSDELSVKLLEEIAGCWEAIGIKTEIIPVETTDTDKLFVEADWYDVALKNLAAVEYDEWYYEYSSKNVLFSNIYQNRDRFDALLQSLDDASWAYEKNMLYREIQSMETSLVYKIPLAITPQYVIYRKEKLDIPLKEFPNVWYYYDLSLAQWKIISNKTDN